MVSNHSQYLCPDFSTPVADTGKSPLALLAQTCNSIGLPENQSKGGKAVILSATEKATSPTSKKTTSAVDRTKADSTDRKSPKSSKSVHVDRSGRLEDGEKHGENGTDAKNDRPGSSQNSEHRSITAPNSQSTSAASQAVQPTFTSTSRYPASFLPPHMYSGFPYQHLGWPPAAAVTMNPFSHCFPGGFPGLSAASTFSSPYSNLPFMTNPAVGGAGMPRVCVDPNCKSCPGRAGACSAVGCNSCTAHSNSTAPDLSAFWLNYASLLHGGVHPSIASSMASSGVVPSTSTTAANSVTATDLTFTSGGSSAPTSSSTTGGNVCYWGIAEGRMCMKRFATSEELMNHMKTHANQDQSANPPLPSATNASPASVSSSALQSNSATATLPTINPFLPLPNMGGSSSSGAAAPFDPMSAYMSGPMSPRNYLSAFRFHPYGGGPKLSPPVASSVGSAATPFAVGAHLPFPTLSPNGYSALSALYGQRLPGSLPHP